MDKKRKTIDAVRGFIPIEGNDAIYTDSKLTEYIFDNCLRIKHNEW